MGIQTAIAETIVERGGKIEPKRRYCLSSAKLDAKTFAHAACAHGGIENRRSQRIPPLKETQRREYIPYYAAVPSCAVTSLPPWHLS